MRLVSRILFALFLSLSPAATIAQTADSTPATPPKTQAMVSFQFERSGLPVPKFALTLKEDGSGRYEADQTEIPATANSMRGQAAQHIDRPILISSATTSKIFKDARALNYFNVECASKAKNIADTGKKTLTYQGADGTGSCTYNYSENKMVQALTDTFEAIAFTLDEGRRFEFLHRYDRLGLDAEMITFSQEVDAGRALELGTISPVLASLVDDGAVIQRVRLKAKKMLDQVAADNH
jgi:hypothetical protein